MVDSEGVDRETVKVASRTEFWQESMTGHMNPKDPKETHTLCPS